MTSTESGLSVPDWPLSYGRLHAVRWSAGVFYEHGHRMVATTVGLLTIVLAVWLARREPRRWVRRLGYLALAAVVAQGVLGGLTVIFLLPTAVSVAHACLAQTFFCLDVAIAVVTSPRWRAAPADSRAGIRARRGSRRRDRGRDLPAARGRRGHAPHEGGPRDPGLPARARAGSFRRSTPSRSRSPSRTGSGRSPSRRCVACCAVRGASAPAGRASRRPRCARRARRRRRSRSAR